MTKQQKTNKEKFLALVSGEDSRSLEAIKWRSENRKWLKKSQAIAFSILRTLKAKKFSQKQLAEKLNVSPQVVNKWLKGKENFTLETVSKIEAALGVTFLQVGVKDHQEVKIEIKISYQQVIKATYISGNYPNKTDTEPKTIRLNRFNTWNENKEYAYN